jgi:Adenylate and Guanylate cyclase catalytic domain/AAA ATPase domain
VREQGGIVQGFTGDGIMAVFGAPVAFEDAPLRACRAALSILQRLKTVGSDLDAQHGVRPQVRIGLNTGPAVVGSVQTGADAGVTVLGDTVNVAARFQALADPDSACMTESTYRLVQGMVEAGFAGEYQIKGKSESQKVYRLKSIRYGAARFDAALSRGLTAYVGRDRELETLERRLADTSTGIQVVDIAGEPGIGKSRLLHEFRQRIGKSSAFILSGSCSPEDRQTPFLPFIDGRRRGPSGGRTQAR